MMRKSIFTKLALVVVLILVLTTNGYASMLQLSGQVVMGSTNSDQDSSDFGVLAKASGQLYPRFHVNADVFATRARTIADNPLAPFESLTQQYFHIGGSYAAIEDEDLTGFLGVGYTIYGYQYRDGEAD